MIAPTEVMGWRIYALSSEGRLRPPWADTLWAEHLDERDQVDGAARCLFLPHPAPAKDCTCGIRATIDLARIIDYGTRTHQLWPQGLLAACGVLARVRLRPPILAGWDMPRDDPDSTWRGAGADLLEVHLSSDHRPHLGTLRGRHPRARVTAHEGQIWWNCVPRQQPPGASTGWSRPPLR